MSDILAKIDEAVYDGEDEIIRDLVQQALDEGVPPEKIISEGGIPALNRLGQDFENLEVFLPELMMAGDTMKILIEVVTPHLEGGKGAYKGTIVMGCAQGDLHDIGKSLVGTQLEVHGFKVIDLGTDVKTNTFIEAAAANNADVIAVSSLLTTSQYYMEELIRRLDTDGIRDKYRVAIGGGPISPEYAEKIGADGYARTADQSARMMERLIKVQPGQELVIEV